MSSSLRPRPLRSAEVDAADPQSVVEAFLAALAAPDLPTAAALLDDRVRYVNVGLPAVVGRRGVMRVLAPLSGRFGFEVYLHAIAADGPTVLTERTDVITLGPLRVQFWVTGRFDVRDGRITLWRDSFDFVDVLRAAARGVAGVAVPALRPPAPSSADTPPGRH